MALGRGTVKGRSGDQTAADGAEYQVGGAVEVQLLHDSPAMGFHRVEAEIEPAGDLFVAVSFSQELVDLALPIGEEFETVVDLAIVPQPRESILKHPGHGGAEVGCTLLNRQ